MPQPILIEFTSKTEGVTTATEAVKTMGETAEREFTKTNNNLKQSDAYWKQVASGVDRYTEKVKQAGDATAGAFVTKGIKELDGAVKNVTNSVETLRAKMLIKQQALIETGDIAKAAQYNKEIAALKKQIDLMLNAGKAGFDDLGNKIQKVVEKEKEQLGIIQKLQRAADLYKKGAIEATSTENIEKYNKKLEETNGKLKQLQNVGKSGFDGVGNKFEEITESIGKTESKSNLLGKAFGFIRQAANFLPGIGIAGIFSLIGESIFSALQEMDLFGKKQAAVSDGMKAINDDAENFSKSLSSVKESAIATGLKLQSFVDIAKDGKIPLAERNEALKEANKILGEHGDKLTLVSVGTAAATEEIKKFTDALIAQALANKYADRIAELMIKSGDLVEDFNKKQKEAGVLAKEIGGLQGNNARDLVDQYRDLIAKRKELSDTSEQYKKVQQDITALTARLNTEQRQSLGLFTELGTKTKVSKTHIKDIADVIKELRKELRTLSEEQDIGKITPKQADIDRVKAYDKAFKGIFDLGGDAATPIVKKLVIEVDPIEKRVLEQQIHDLVEKMPRIEDKILAPSDRSAELRALIVKNTTDSIQKIADLNDRGYLHDLENQKSYLEAGYITQEEYAKRVEALKDEHSRSELSNQVALSEGIISNLKARGFDTTAEERKLVEQKLQLYDLDNRNFEKLEKKKTKTAKDQLKNREALIQAGATLLLGVNEILDQRDKERIDGERTRNQELLDQKLITQAEFNKRQEKLKQDEAALSKRKAIFDIFIETAKQIFTIKAQAAAVFGIPGVGPGLSAAALSQIPMVLISEGIQLALITARKFKTGKVRIDGPGTETSDSIPAFLSRNESVINAQATKRYQPALEAINAMKFEEYLLTMKAPVFEIPNIQPLPRWADTSLARTGPAIDYERMAEALAAKLPGVDVRIDKQGIVVIAKQGMEKTQFVNRKYSFKK